MADHSARIAEIQSILRSGVTETTVDGTKTVFDLASLRRELRLLMADDDTHGGRRPVVATMDMS